jgi:acyl-CoA synthetase (AMP-forming)/AMP-acid ligase II
MDSGIPSFDSIKDILSYHAARAPHSIALDFEGRQTTYLDLDTASNQAANGIRALVASSTRVAVLDKNSDTFLEVCFGVFKANAVLVPVNARLAPPEIAFILNDSKSEILFVGEGYLDAVNNIREQLETVRNVIVLNEEYLRWRDSQSTTPQRANETQDVRAQLYTSGTTGRPKGAQLTDVGLRIATSRLLKVYGVCGPEKSSLIVLPLFHIAGLQFALTALRAGMKAVILRDFDSRRILKIINRDRINISFLVPTMLKALVDEFVIQPVDVSSLEGVVYGTSPMPLDLIKAVRASFSRTDFIHAYGLTETTGTITAVPRSVKVSESVLLNSCGQALDGVELRVVAPNGADVPIGEIGEILCRSSSNMKGYWNREAENTKVFNDGWMSTGDAGYLDIEGFLYICDRVKDIIISGGENIYPAEVENALCGHPDIAEVAVIGVPDERWGEAVKALVVLKAAALPDPNELIRYARQQLAGFKVPKTIEFLPCLPRNGSGKVLKSELRERYGAGARQV